MADKIDYKPFVGKKFKSQVTAGLNHGAIFEIKEVSEKFDFGTAGGVKPAFRLQRSPSPGMHWEQCDKFLASHDEVKEEAAPTEK